VQQNPETKFKLNHLAFIILAYTRSLRNKSIQSNSEVCVNKDLMFNELAQILIFDYQLNLRKRKHASQKVNDSVYKACIMVVKSGQ